MGLRWLITLVLTVFLASSSTADAQAFKPRGGAKTEKKAPKKSTKKAAKKSTRSKKRVKKAPPREAEIERSEPDEDDDDYVLIEDDDE